MHVARTGTDLAAPFEVTVDATLAIRLEGIEVASDIEVQVTVEFGQGYYDDDPYFLIRAIEFRPHLHRGQTLSSSTVDPLGKVLWDYFCSQLENQTAFNEAVWDAFRQMAHFA